MKKFKIDSPSNPKVKELLKQINSYYIFEGEKLVKDILKKRIKIDYLLVNKTNEVFVNNIEDWRKISYLYVLDKKVLKKFSNLKSVPEYIAFVNIKPEKVNFNKTDKLFVLFDIQDPANAGNIFRCASAFGIKHILFTKESVKPNNPKFIRVAQSSLFDIKYFRYESFEEILNILSEKGFNIYLTSSHNTKRTIDVSKVKKPFAIIIGNEGKGVDEKYMLQYKSIRINQTTNIESLNAGISACILMYELFK